MGSEREEDPVHRILRKHISENPPDPREREREAVFRSAYEKGQARRALLELPPEAVLDLHGLSALEAEERLSGFLSESARRGLRKILVVHGKGIHSSGEPVLGKTVRRILERSPFAAEFGRGSPREGGSGVSWVILRKRDDYRSR
jgi:DNA-nicking Smr family endonuclease